MLNLFPDRSISNWLILEMVPFKIGRGGALRFLSRQRLDKNQGWFCCRKFARRKKIIKKLPANVRGQT